MIKVFLDANVYFSAARSKTGGSSAIIKLIKAKKLSCYATKTVLREAEKNIRLKEPVSTLIDFYQIVTEIKLNIVVIDKNEAEKRYTPVINRKDSYILEGTRKAKVDYLVTLDKKHFFTQKIQNTKLPFITLTPGDLLKELS